MPPMRTIAVVTAGKRRIRTPVPRMPRPRVVENDRHSAVQTTSANVIVVILTLARKVSAVAELALISFRPEWWHLPYRRPMAP